MIKWGGSTLELVRQFRFAAHSKPVEITERFRTIIVSICCESLPPRDGYSRIKNKIIKQRLRGTSAILRPSAVSSTLVVYSIYTQLVIKQKLREFDICILPSRLGNTVKLVNKRTFGRLPKINTARIVLICV